MKQFFLKRSNHLNLSIGLISFIIFGLGVYTIKSINDLAILTKKLYDHPFTVNRAVLRVENGIVSMHRSMKDVALANDTKEMEIAKEKVAQYEQQVLENLDIIIDNFLGDTNLIKESRQKFVQWRSIRERVILLRQAGKIQEAAAITKGEGDEYIKNLLAEMDEFETFAGNKAIQFVNSVEQTHQEIMSFSIVLIILITLLIILLILRSSLFLKEKTQAKIRLEESLAMYSSILASISDAVFITNDSSKFTYICPNVEHIFSYSEEEIAELESIEKLLGKGLFDHNELEKRGEITNIERKIDDKKGTAHDLLINIKQVDIQKGTILYTCRDISDRQVALRERTQAETELIKAKQELEIKEEMFRSTFEQAAVGIAHVSPEGKFIRLNQKFCEIAGHPLEGLMKFSFQDITHPDDLETDLNYVKQVIEGDIQNYSMEKRYISKKGIWVWINLTVSLVRHPDGNPNYFIAVIEDISERKETENKLKDMTYALNTAAIVAITDEKGEITFVNDLFCEISQYTKEELMGQNHRILNSGYHPHEFFVKFWQTISSGKTWKGEIKNSAKDGSFYWVDTTIVPFLNNRGKPYQYLAIRSDITQKKTAHIKLKQEMGERQKAMLKLEEITQQLEDSNKELQDFAYVASHDLQEPLRKIQAFGDRLNSTCKEALSEKGQDYLARMLNAAHRGQNLINDLLAFSRVTTKAKPFEALDLNEVLKGVLSDLEIRIEETGAIIEIDILPVIEADAMQMRQIFQNLLSNALKFRKKEVSPLIQLQALLYQKEDTDYCEIRVTDNGIGFDQKYADRIFQPFQRLHGRSAYEGSGIGLAICRKIAQRHHGILTVESIPDEGTTFVLTLPIYQNKQEKNV